MKGTDFRAMCKRQWAADAVVLGWMGIGFTLDLTPNVYLLVGIPITLAFQRDVAKRPLRALWRPPTAPFRMDTKFLVVVAVLGLLPAVSVVHELATGRFVIAIRCTNGTSGSAVYSPHREPTYFSPALNDEAAGRS